MTDNEKFVKRVNTIREDLEATIKILDEMEESVPCGSCADHADAYERGKYVGAGYALEEVVNALRNLLDDDEFESLLQSNIVHGV